MPTYVFENKETGEIFERIFPYKEKKKYLEENPDIQDHYGQTPAVVRSGTIRPGKTDSDFNSMLKKVGKFYKGSNVNTW